MRSAIHYPDIQIKSTATMRSALLLWDKLHVIVPYEGFRPNYQNANMRNAWNVIGKTMCPDDHQKAASRRAIEEMLEQKLDEDFFWRRRTMEAGGDMDDLPYDEMWPQKLSHQSWARLQRSRVVRMLAGGNYEMSAVAGQTIMAEVADACAGDVFARTTDRFLSYGLVAERAEETAAQMAVIPMTLSMIDASSIAFERLIDFREREQREAAGHHYTQMRHRYADAISAHVEQTMAVESRNQLDELRRQFAADMERDLADLKEALNFNKKDLILSTAVVSTAVAAGSYLAQNGLEPLTIAAMTAPALAASIERVAGLFRVGAGYSAKQRKIMAEHPMAYMYALSKAQ